MMKQTRKKKLTDTQSELLEKIKLFKYVKNSDGCFAYDDMKAVCEFKSFDNSFNALLHKGYVEHVKTNDYSNRFKLTI